MITITKIQLVKSLLLFLADIMFSSVNCGCSNNAPATLTELRNPKQVNHKVDNHHDILSPNDGYCRYISVKL